MAAVQAIDIVDVRDLILVRVQPYVAARCRRVCRAWRDSAALGAAHCEDIVREVAFLFDHCILREFVFEESL